MPGPGSYVSHELGSMSEALKHKSARSSQKQTVMPQASREFTFAKYSSINANIYGRGLM